MDARRADVVERVDAGLAVAQALGEGQRPLTPPHRLRIVGREHRELCRLLSAIAELASLRQRLQQRGRLLRVGHGVVAAPAEPGQPREPAQAVALGEPVAERAAQLDLLGARGKGVVDPIGDVALVGEGGEQVGARSAGPSASACRSARS